MYQNGSYYAVVTADFTPALAAEYGPESQLTSNICFVFLREGGWGGHSPKGLALMLPDIQLYCGPNTNQPFWMPQAYFLGGLGGAVHFKY